MAVKFTKYGLQSYDPLEVLKKKITGGAGRGAVKKKKKKEPEEKKKVEPARVGVKRQVGFIEREGEKFALPAIEMKGLEKAGKLLPGETLPEQAVARREADIEEAEATEAEVQRLEIEKVIEEREKGRAPPIEEAPLYSGQAMPITAEDLTDVVTMFAGLGFAKIGGKTAFKALLSKAKKGALPVAEAQVLKRRMLKTITKKISTRMGLIMTAVVAGQITAIAGMLIAPYLTQRITAEDRQIRSIDTAMSQVRETITLPFQLVKAGATIEEGLEQLDTLRDTVSYGKQKIQELRIESYEMKTNPEFTLPMELRIAKLEGFLDLTERQLITAQVTGEGITAEALQELMMAYEEIFGREENE